ncbi:MAG: ATP-dependent protease LonB [Candidatus Micrarchaeia archaeon]
MGKAAGVFEKFSSTSEIPVSDHLIDQIIGQEKAVEVIRKAAMQKRNVLLVGVPGTGKSMLAQGMAELLPVQELQDLLVVANPEDENVPKVKVVRAGDGRKMVAAERMRNRMPAGGINVAAFLLMAVFSMILLYFGRQHLGDIITAAMLIGLFVMGGAMMFASQLGRGRFMAEPETSKLLVDNTGRKKAPFFEATGAKAGALLGDVRHDPFQSGGLGTPPHLRVEAGFVHKANKGVLFVDEVATLRPKSQQELLTAMQEKKYSITGQSEMSSGAQVRTEPVPCDFVLVAAGNYGDIQKMHPALRSRIRGYGYEVYMEEAMADTEENREKILRFIAQEVKKDGKIPHFSREAALEILKEARKRSGRKGKLTLKLRELGGLIRAAGDIAKERNAQEVSLEHVFAAKKVSRTLEQQATQQYIDVRKDYKVFVIEGAQVGRVNGLAVMGEAGLVMPIVAEVAPAASKQEGKIIATGKLGKIAEEAVENVSAILKKHLGKDTSSYDMHVQFLQTYEGVEGDSASISVATAIISALEGAPVEQDVAMTGSLSVRGDVLPVGGVTQKVEAAIESGIRRVILPAANAADLVLDEGAEKKIEIIKARNLYDVLEHSLAKSKKKQELLNRIKKELA